MACWQVYEAGYSGDEIFTFTQAVFDISLFEKVSLVLHKHTLFLQLFKTELSIQILVVCCICIRMWLLFGYCCLLVGCIARYDRLILFELLWFAMVVCCRMYCRSGWLLFTVTCVLDELSTDWLLMYAVGCIAFCDWLLPVFCWLWCGLAWWSPHHDDITASEQGATWWWTCKHQSSSASISTRLQIGC